MNWKEHYQRWMNDNGLAATLKQQLIEKQYDQTWLEDSFYKRLEFGTGGMRGEIGPGINKMNMYTIRKAAAGLAKFIADQGEDACRRGVVIAYDSRFLSYDFAMEAAKTLGFLHIKVYVFAELRPTPELSFAVRELKAFAGIVITASHNPKEYNGFKVYGEDGGQLPLKASDQLTNAVNQIDDELKVAVADEQVLKAKGLLHMIGTDMDEAYTEKVKTIVIQPSLLAENLVKVVFTPLHGTGNKPVRRCLDALGFTNYTVVAEQEQPDPEFSTVVSPNPEEHAAFQLAIRDGQKVDADLLIGTDPDADRLGIAVKDEQGAFTVLTGNQTGALFLHYLLSQKQQNNRLPANGVVLKTIVTSEFGRQIASHFGLTTIDTLTGFKFIGEKIREFEVTGTYQFQFGFEESYGYLIGDFVRDKDAVQAAVLAVEVASFYKQQGKSLYEGLQALYEQFGFYQEALKSVTLKGKNGMEKINEMMNRFRSHPPKIMAEKQIVVIEDYLSQKRTNAGGLTEVLDLPAANVLKYFLEDGSWFCVRPSGTEPKIKFYFGTTGVSLSESKHKLTTLVESVLQEIGS